MPSAAGLNRLPARDRNAYLDRTATTDAAVATYHGACALSTMATIIAVSTAPLGNSHRVWRARRMIASRSPATATAPKSAGATVPMPSCGAAMAARTARTMVRRPFGVLKKRRMAFTLFTPQACGLEALECGREDQPADAVPLEKANAVGGAEHEHCGGEGIGEHGRRRDDSDAGSGRWRRAGPGIENVVFLPPKGGSHEIVACVEIVAGHRAFVVAGGADGPIRDAQRVDQLAVAARMPDADGPCGARGIAAAEIEVAAGVDGEVGVRLELAGGGVDSEPLGYGPEIERQRPRQRDRPRRGVEDHVAVGGVAQTFRSATGAGLKPCATYIGTPL